MKVKDLIGEREIYCVSTGDFVQKVAELMSEKGIGAVPVLDGTNLVGIFTERDLLRRIIAEKRNPAKTTVEEVMTPELIIASPDFDVQDCVALMRKYNIRHLPVVKETDLAGIISLRDLLNMEIEDKDFEIKVLNEYIHYIPPYAVRKNLSGSEQ
ncbi:MAG: CBS domain-containing protein [Calditrichia bacterium]